MLTPLIFMFRRDDTPYPLASFTGIYQVNNNINQEKQYL